MFDYIVVGAGIAGCVMAERLASQMDKKILLIEQRDHIGGNCYDYKDQNNIIIHKYGPHLFHTENKEVVEYLSQFTEWDNYHHKVLAFIDGKKAPIPFNLNTIYDLFPDTLAKKLEEKLLQNYEYNSKVPILELKKSTDEDLQFLADFIYEKIFLHYSAKQWGLRPEDMDSAVTARVPVFIGRDDRYFNDKYQMLPKHGYSAMIQNILRHKNIKLMLNTNFHEMCSLKKNKVYLFGSEFKGKVIYTGAIDELFEYEFGELPYRSVDMRFESVDTEYYQEVSTVNYPNNYDYTRITEFKHVHPCKSKKTTILREYPQAHIPGKTTPYYPIFTSLNQEKYKKYLEHSKAFKQIQLIGRLAEYKYYDIDDIVEEALALFEKERK